MVNCKSVYHNECLCMVLDGSNLHHLLSAVMKPPVNICNCIGGNIQEGSKWTQSLEAMKQPVFNFKDVGNLTPVDDQ